MANIDMHSRHSTLRERIVEHIFVGEALRALWQRGVTDVEILRAEFDAHGYDLVMGRGAVVRHIQFKTGVRSKPAPVSVVRALAEKPSGCVIWISLPYSRGSVVAGMSIWAGVFGMNEARVITAANLAQEIDGLQG